MKRRSDNAYKLAQYIILWIIGGFSYVLLEILYRGRSHWSMAIVGGLCFISVGALNEPRKHCRPKAFEEQAVMGALVTTIIEFISGLIINVYLKWEVWDYSNTPFNILGQICLPFTLIWVVIAAIAIILDDLLRHILFLKPLTKYWFLCVHKEIDVFEFWKHHICKHFR